MREKKLTVKIVEREREYKEMRAEVIVKVIKEKWSEINDER